MAWLRPFVVCVALAQSVALAADLPTAQTFRIATTGDAILLPVDVGGSEHLLVFDTGSNATAFDLSLRSTLGDELRRRMFGTPNGALEVISYAPPPMSIGARPLRSVREIACVDLDGPRRAYGKPIMGLLGMDAIWTMIVRIDFDSGELSILPSLPVDLGEPLELFRDRGLPCVRVQAADGQPDYFTIDTGAGGMGSGDLESRLFNSLLEAGALRVVGDRLTATVVRTTRVRLGRVAELRIGSNRHSNLILQEGSRNALSLGFLSRYAVVFDFPSKRMYLSPGKRFNDPDRHNLSGLHLSTVDGKRIVKSLDDHSAAQRAGIRVGDVLLSVDQTAIDSLSKRELQRMLGTPSTRWLTIRRGEATMQCKIELREEHAPSEPAPPPRTARRNTFFQKLLPRAE